MHVYCNITSPEPNYSVEIKEKAQNIINLIFIIKYQDRNTECHKINVLFNGFYPKTLGT